MLHWWQADVTAPSTPLSMSTRRFQAFNFFRLLDASMLGALKFQQAPGTVKDGGFVTLWSWHALEVYLATLLISALSSRQLTKPLGEQHVQGFFCWALKNLNQESIWLHCNTLQMYGPWSELKNLENLTSKVSLFALPVAVRPSEFHFWITPMMVDLPAIASCGIIYYLMFTRVYNDSKVNINVIYTNCSK